MSTQQSRLSLFGLATLFVVGVSCADKPAPAAGASGAPAAIVSSGPSPDSFRVAFETSRGNFVVQVVRAWAPQGADRFHALVQQHFFDGERFFRVIPGFVAQFGLTPDAKGNAPWDAKPIADDSVRQSNTHGTVSFASMGPRTRTHQLFINLADNAQLDGMGFPPLGRVVEGLSVVDSLYSGYGDNPDQTMIQSQGNAYLDRAFPKLDYIKTARIAAPK